MENAKPKITQVESFIILAILAGLDIVDVALLIVGLDDFFLLDIVAFPITQLYFRMKGVRANYMLFANVAEVIPYVGKLPLRTIGALVTIRQANNPEGLLAEVVGVAEKGAARKLALTSRRTERQ